MSAVTSPEISGFEGFTLVKDRSDFTYWQATQLEPRRMVEIAVARPDASPAVLARALAVYTHIAGASSQYVQRIYEINAEAPAPYVVAEHITGRSLYEAVKHNGPFDVPHTLRFAKQIGHALAILNEQRPFAVRNLKPDNIRIDVAGNAKICDFSLAMLPGTQYGVAADEGNVVGTPQYISPEQADALPTVDFRTDFYSLGAVLYFACTGVVPFDDDDVYKVLELQKTGTLPDPRTLRPAITYRLARLISLLMVKDPANRYATWEDMISDVGNAEAGKPLALLVPDGAATTVPVAFEEELAATVETPHAAPAQKAPDHLRKLAGKDSGPLPSAKASLGHFALWVLLVAWFVWFADLRIGNPLGLPAPDPMPAWLYEPPAPPPGKVAVTIPGAVRPPVAEQPEVPPPASPSARPQTGASPTASVAPEGKSDAPVEDKAAAFSEAATRVEPELSTWAPSVMEQVRKGNFAAAKKLAEESKSTLGAKVAAQLVRVPDLNKTIVQEIMKKEGRDVTLTYMGKARELVPMSAEGNVVTTSFNGRTVKVDVSQLSPEEKLRWLDDAEGDGAHILGVSLALQLADDEALARHAAFAGALRGLLEGK